MPVKINREKQCECDHQKGQASLVEFSIRSSMTENDQFASRPNLEGGKVRRLEVGNAKLSGSQFKRDRLMVL